MLIRVIAAVVALLWGIDCPASDWFIFPLLVFFSFLETVVEVVLGVVFFGEKVADWFSKRVAELKNRR